MNKAVKKIIYIFLFLMLLPACFFQASTVPEFTPIQTTHQLETLFPKTRQQITELSQTAINDATKQLAVVLNIEPDDRTFTNTVLAFDRLSGHFQSKFSCIYLLTMVSPDADLRAAAHEQIIVLQNFAIDKFSLNKQLYTAFVDYQKTSLHRNESLTVSQKEFITKTIEDFERSGLKESPEVQERIKKIQKELAAHGLAYDKNIAASNTITTVELSELAGLDEDFISNLKQTANNKYILGTDNPTYQKVMENCSVQSTRKAMWRAYARRGYPDNQKELKTIIALRDELAKLLGYTSYAHLDIDEQMAKSPEHVEEFLNNLIKRCENKVQKEIKAIKEDLPEGVVLSPDGKLYPWDVNYIENYRKKKLDVDEQLIANYFPLEHTLQELLFIYEKFFGLSFNKVEISKNSFWHPDIQVLSVSKDGNFIGSVLLDLFPREHKYTHYCELSLMKHIKTNNSEFPAVVTVIANFPPAENNKPALLKRQDVITFFHEFGHAIHDLLGATQLYAQAGTNVKSDFVEMPSQMLEEWMWDPKILKQISKHYKTGQQLPDELIAKIITLKNLSAGLDTQRQIVYAFISLDYFKAGADKDIKALWRNLSQSLRPDFVYDEENHAYCAFSHLIGYGAKYYGYLWSKVFALDLFNYIKQVGLLDGCIGAKYIRQVIGKGGSEGPEELLKNFLGREPNANAFFADLGV